MDYEGTRETETEAALSDAALAKALPELAAAATANLRTGGTPLVPDANNTIVLPDGATLDDITVHGRDLVIQTEDGRTYVVADGAVFVPQIIAQGVTVPPLNLAALLIGHEPEPAAGGVRSSGGDFAVPPGAIQDAYKIGNLLPYTELAFTTPPTREIFPQIVASKPTIVIVTPNNPVGVSDATASVDEAGLPARGDKPAGSNLGSNSEITNGTLEFASPGGVQAVTLNGVAITQVGQILSGTLGTLTITSIDLANGKIGYTYTLTDNTLNDSSVGDKFTAVVTEPGGNAATATLTVNVIDDHPTAHPDSYTLTSGQTVTTQNVEGNDVFGADGKSGGGVVGVAAGSDTSVVLGTGVGTAITTSLGTLTL
ncbi:MAG: hypothetical protein KGM49_13435, partial [Sphingomonadales bacterium]|nr:hypothetical protein [Sphingomonadales bacterium]